MKTQSALSYYGSDSEVAQHIASLLNHCSHVTIPFCGGLAILPHLTARAVVANDANCHAIDFYRVASGFAGKRNQKDLFERCEHTLSHPQNLLQASAALESPNIFHRAWAYWAICWIGRKGKGGTKDGLKATMPSVRRTAKGGNNATRIRSAARDLKEWAANFERCEFECRDFRDLLPRCADDVSCGIYCDPPWIDAGDCYLEWFTERDHIVFRDMLRRFLNTTVVVRYGDHPTIRELYRGWNVIEASSRTQANKDRPELWITNKA